MNAIEYSCIENPTEEQINANKKVEAVGAPLGLYEWKCSDGEIYLNSKMALAHEVGISKRGKD